MFGPASKHRAKLRTLVPIPELASPPIVRRGRQTPGMRRIVLSVVLAACSNSAHEHVSPTVAAAVTSVDPSARIAPEVTGVMRSTTTDSPALMITNYLQGNQPTCWNEALAKISAVYHADLAGQGSYYIFTGELPRDQIKRCARAALATRFADLNVTDDGDLVAFDLGKVGTVYVDFWRGGFVAGTKSQVTAAHGGPGAALAATWQQRLARLPTMAQARFAAVRADALLGGWFGVATTSYQIVIDRDRSTSQAFNPVPPMPSVRFTGRVVAEYASTADAVLAARRIRDGELHTTVAPPATLVEIVKRLKVTQVGTTVELGFDDKTFAGVDVNELQRWATSSIAASSALPAAP